MTLHRHKFEPSGVNGNDFYYCACGVSTRFPEKSKTTLNPKALGDLYKALTEMVALLDGYSADEGAPPDARKIEKRAKAALSKARGE